jgi:hypothetical protein
MTPAVHGTRFVSNPRPDPENYSTAIDAVGAVLPGVFRLPGARRGSIMPGATRLLLISGSPHDALDLTGPLVTAPFLLKPFNPQGLRLEVREVLDATASR